MLPKRQRIVTAREAGVRFIQGSASGWGRRELAEWLVGHYAPCAVPAGEDRPERECRRPQFVREEVIARLVREAHEDALILLPTLRDPMRLAAIGRVMINSGFVGIVNDERGARAYSPIALPRMKLTERVASLFVADCLNAPFDYRWVYVCGQCNAVSFGTSVLCCAPRRRDSEVRLRNLVESLTPSSLATSSVA